MASRQLLERLPNNNKLWTNSSQGKVFDKYTVVSEIQIPVVYNSASDGSSVIVLDNTYDLLNEPSDIYLTDDGYKQFTDGGTLTGNYSSGIERAIIFDAGANNFVYINPVSFETEHSTPSLMEDRLGILASDDYNEMYSDAGNLDNTKAPTLSPHLYQSNTTTYPWSDNYSPSNGGYGTGGGWIFPSSSGIDAKFNDNSSWVNTWHKINARYVKFVFRTNNSVTDTGWNILLAREVTPPSITRTHYLKDSNGTTINTEHISNLWFFGKTMTTLSYDHVFINNDIVITIEINQGGSTWWAHPTTHVIPINDLGGIMIPHIHNFGFNNIRFNIYNTSATDCRVDLFFRYN
jgi:hypothetical protein